MKIIACSVYYRKQTILVSCNLTGDHISLKIHTPKIACYEFDVPCNVTSYCSTPPVDQVNSLFTIVHIALNVFFIFSTLALRNYL